MNKAIGTTVIDESLEVEIGKNIHGLNRARAGFRHLEDADDEMSGRNLSTLLDLVTERSRREVESLIDELHGLRKKLENDRDRIQSEIARYSELSQGVMQLASIISDNVKKLPNPT
jgi:hypothetical protein